MVNSMQKRLNNGFQMPQSNISRIGRKVFFSCDVTEDSIHELIRVLEEIECEDNEQQPQEKAEILINDFMTSVDLIKNKKYDKKLVYQDLDDSIHTYNSDCSLDREPIKLYISSFGGSVYDVFAFVDYIETMKTPIHTIAIGKAMSCGAIMLLAGDRRFSTQNSTILLHQISSGTWGTLQGMLESVNETQRLSDKVNDLIIERTHIDEEFLLEIQESKYDYYMDVQEALELGIIDEII